MWLKEPNKNEGRKWIEYDYALAKTGRYGLYPQERPVFLLDLFKEAIIEDIFGPIFKLFQNLTYRDWLAFVAGCFVCSWFWFGLILGWWPQ